MTFRRYPIGCTLRPILFLLLPLAAGRAGGGRCGLSHLLTLTQNNGNVCGAANPRLETTTSTKATPLTARTLIRIDLADHQNLRVHLEIVLGIRHRTLHDL